MKTLFAIVAALTLSSPASAAERPSFGNAKDARAKILGRFHDLQEKGALGPVRYSGAMWRGGGAGFAWSTKTEVFTAKAKAGNLEGVRINVAVQDIGGKPYYNVTTDRSLDPERLKENPGHTPLIQTGRSVGYW